jgi:hypothetical protein
VFKSILVLINTQNHDAVRAIFEPLSPSEKTKFELAFKDSLPEFPFAGVQIEIPKFDPKSAATFRQKISRLADKLSAEKWAWIRPDVYRELSDSLLSLGNEKAALTQIERLIDEKGTGDYYRLLPGLLVQMKGDSAQIAERIFAKLVSQVKPKPMMAAIESHLLSPTVTVQIAAIEILTKMISVIGDGEPPSLRSLLIPSLSSAFESDAPEVRRAVTLCFVELKVLLKDDLDPYLAKLKKSQQKLIDVYFERRTSGSGAMPVRSES